MKNNVGLSFLYKLEACSSGASRDKSALNLLSECKTVFMKKVFSFFLLLFSYTAFAQFHLGVFAGGSNYLGDLSDKPYRRTKPAVGLSINYEVSDRFMLRSGITLGKIEGADKYSSNEFLEQNRNLSFKSNIAEFSLIGELTAFNLYNIRWSPYAFAGISVYRFNPYVNDSVGGKVYLQPLGTEGQGSTQYPERKKYSLTQFAIPFGGGIKYNLNDNVRLGFEVGLRRLFTDYLDDASGFYADEDALLATGGPNALQYAYRGDEVPGQDPNYPDVGYPVKNAERANPKTKDWFYFTGLHLTFRIGGSYGKTHASGNRKGYGCPVNPM